MVDAEQHWWVLIVPGYSKQQSKYRERDAVADRIGRQQLPGKRGELGEVMVALDVHSGIVTRDSPPRRPS